MHAARFGLSVALATPFTADGRIDQARLAAHARGLIARGCDKVTLFGTTGEGASIGIAERAAAIDALIGAGIDPRRQIVVGVAASALEDAAAQARDALDRNVHALMIAPPFYFKGPSEAGLLAWFGALFARLEGRARDVILYHIPSVTAVALPPGFVRALASAHPGVITGVKDSSGSRDEMLAFLAALPDLDVMVGDETLLADAVARGGAGTICGLANLAPELLRPAIDHARDDARIAAAVAPIGRHPFIAAIKAILAAQTRDPGWAAVRPPFRPLDAASAAAVVAEFDRALAARAA